MPDQPNSAEDTDSVKRDLDEIPDALAWPTNVFARSEAQTIVDDRLQNYPDRVIPSPIEFVNSSNELLADVLNNPSYACDPQPAAHTLP
jgi:hypothetical protein